MDSVASLAGVPNTELFNKINGLEKENSTLKMAIDDLRNLVISLQARVDSLEKSGAKIEAPQPNAVTPKVSPSIFLIILQSRCVLIISGTDLNCQA